MPHNRLKGQCHEVDIFLKGQNILVGRYFLSICADGFQGLSKLSLPNNTIVKVLFASVKLLTNF